MKCGNMALKWRLVEHRVQDLQSRCFSRIEPGLEESSPKGSIAAADDYCWSSYFCSFWLLHVGFQLLLGCKRHEHPSVKVFCVVLC